MDGLTWPLNPSLSARTSSAFVDQFYNGDPDLPRSHGEAVSERAGVTVVGTDASLRVCAGRRHGRGSWIRSWAEGVFSEVAIGSERRQNGWTFILLLWERYFCCGTIGVGALRTVARLYLATRSKWGKPFVPKVKHVRPLHKDW